MLNLDKPRILAAGQIHLGDITRDHSFRIKAQTCQEHFHLLHSRVLCLVQNNERVIERPSPHESKRSHFNSHGQISFSRTRRTNTDDEIMLADRLDVTPLPQAFWTDETLLRWHSNTLG